MKKILALLLIASLVVGVGAATKRPLYGDESALTTDVTTDTAGIGVIVAAANGLQTDVDALEAGVMVGTTGESAPASYVTATYTSSMDGANNDIVFTAVPGASWGGTLGNSIDIILTDPGEDTTACSVSANATTGDVDVTLSYGSGAINATAITVMAAIAADSTASGMVTCDNATGDDGSGTVTALTSQDLSGGVNGTAGTTGQRLYYGGDWFYLISGSAFYDATWNQVDGADTDGSISSTRSYTTTATVTGEQLTSTDDATITDDLGVGGDTTIAGALDVDGATTLDAVVIAETLDVTTVATSVTGTTNSAYIISMQIIADADAVTGSEEYILNDAALNESENVYTVWANELTGDVPRAVVVDPAASYTGTVTIYGTDMADAAVSEVLTFSSDAAQTTAAAFKDLTNITASARTGGGDTTMDVGLGSRLGLNTVLTDAAQVVSASMDNVYETTRPTVTVSATTLSLNTIDPNTANDGSKDLKIYTVV